MFAPMPAELPVLATAFLGSKVHKMMLARAAVAIDQPSKQRVIGPRAYLTGFVRH